MKGAPRTPVLGCPGRIADLSSDDGRNDVVYDDPHGYYGKLRESDPVHWDELRRMWLVTRYEDVSYALRRPALFSSERAARDKNPVDPPIRGEDLAAHRFVVEFRALELIQNDPPAHDRMRFALNRAFSPKALESWRPRIRAVVDALIDKAVARGSMDLVTDVGAPLPLSVISELLGIPEADRVRLKELADLRMASTSIGRDAERMARSVRGITATNDYLDGLISQRLEDPRDDLLTAFATAEREGRYSRDEVLANVQSVIDAGHETTIQLICNGMLSLLRHRDAWELLCSNPEALAAPATEECLRYNPPLTVVQRIAAEDCHLHGRSIEAGDRVTLVVASANHDPRAFNDPDRFNIERRPNNHLSFAVGVHFCLGQYLARLEGQEVLRALSIRLPTLRLATESVSYHPILTIRSLVSLPVIWE